MKNYIFAFVAVAIFASSAIPQADAATRAQRIAARNFNQGFRAGAAAQARAQGFHHGFGASGFGVRSFGGCANGFCR